MRGHFGVLEAQVPQRSVDRVLADWLSDTSGPWENELTSAREGSNFVQKSHRLRRQWNDVGSFGLTGGVPPFCCVQVDIRPASMSQFTRPNEKHC